MERLLLHTPYTPIACYCLRCYLFFLNPAIFFFILSISCLTLDLPGSCPYRPSNSLRQSVPELHFTKPFSCCPEGWDDIQAPLLSCFMSHKCQRKTLLHCYTWHTMASSKQDFIYVERVTLKALPPVFEKRAW